MRADIHDGQEARNAPCNGPNTDARDQLSPDRHIRLAPHGRSIQKYMVKRRGPSSQGWKTFLRNHAPDIAAMDLFVVPTIGFKLLYGFVIVRISRRDLVWINVTTNPTAEWVARQSRNMKSYARYYNGFRTHRSLNKDTSNSRPVQRSGPISTYVILAELHHHYARV